MSGIIAYTSYTSDKSAESAKEGARLSADAAVASTEKNIDFQTWLWGEQRDLAQPYADMGEGAIPEYNTLRQTPIDMYEDPSYQFGLNEGINAIDNSGSAKGMQLSGPQLKRLNRFGQDYGTTKYNEAFNRRQVNLDNLYRMITSGQAAAAGQAATGGQMGSQVSSAINTAGQARSQMYSDIGNINAQNDMATYNTLMDIGGLYATYAGGKG